jgi:hypothetical protein
MLVGRPVVMCSTCYDAVGGSAVVVYPQPHGRSQFPALRVYCDEGCRERGERSHIGPTVTVDWETFLRDLAGTR